VSQQNLDNLEIESLSYNFYDRINMINRISNYISGLVEAGEYRYGGSNQRLDGGI